MSKYLQQLGERAAAEAAAKKVRNESNRANTKYRAIVNFDFTNPNQNEYQRLIAALLQIGWKYVETSALVFDGDLPNVLLAMELISKQCESSGTLSALTFHIQGSTSFDGRPYPQSKSYPDALKHIRKKRLPDPILKNAS